MPRIDFKLCDRVYILKLICTAQMTYSSFITLIYFYLIILQSWTNWEGERTDIMDFKWSVITVSILEFCLGTLLAFAANMTGIRCRRRIIAWLILETLLVPVSISLLMQLYYRIVASAIKFSTDPHYARVNIAQVCLLLCQYIFIAFNLDFLVCKQPKPKMYDPSIRPESVYEPTDPQITTTESRHIRMSQSFLFQPSSSKKVTINEFKDEGSSYGSSEDRLTNEETNQRSNERIKYGQGPSRNPKTHKENEDENERSKDKIRSMRSTEKIEEKEWEEEEVQDDEKEKKEDEQKK